MKPMRMHIRDITIAVIIFFTAYVVYGVEALASTMVAESEAENFVSQSLTDNLQLRIEPASQIELPIVHTVDFFSDQVNISLCVVTMYKPNLRVEVADNTNSMHVLSNFETSAIANSKTGSTNIPTHFDAVCEENGRSSFTLKRNVDETDAFLDMVTLVISPE